MSGCLVKGCSRAAAGVGAGASTVALAAVARRCVAALAAVMGINSRGKSLNNAVASKHAAIYGEIPAHHESTHSSIFLGQNVRFIGKIRLVFTPIDKNKAGEATGVSIALIRGVCPSTSSAETYYTPLVSQLIHFHVNCWTLAEADIGVARMKQEAGSRTAGGWLPRGSPMPRLGDAALA